MHHVAHLLVAAVDRVAGGIDQIVDITRIAGSVGDLAGKLVDSSGKLFNRACLLGSALRERLRAARDLLGTARDLLGRLVDLPEGVVERLNDLVSGNADRSKIAEIFHIHLGVEVAVRQHLEFAADMLDVIRKGRQNKPQVFRQVAQLILRLIGNNPMQVTLSHPFDSRFQLKNRAGEVAGDADGEQNRKDQADACQCKEDHHAI